MSNQYDGAVVGGSPKCNTPHKLPCPDRDLKIRIIPDIRLQRVDNHKLRFELDNGLSEMFIIQGKTAIHFFIYKCDVPAISSTSFQSRLNRVTGSVLGTLVDNPLWPTQRFSVRSRAAFGKLCDQIHHHGRFPVSRITLQERDLADSDVRVPQPPDRGCLDIAVEGQ